MSHPKTTIAGILTIIISVGGAALAFVNGHLDNAAITACMAGIATGIGLIKGADGDKV
jgi:hypothetical protein